MQSIKEYCWSLIIISVTVGICLLLAPENRASAKHLKFIGALCIASFMLSPLSRIIDYDLSSVVIKDIGDDNEITESDRERAIIEEAEKLIGKEIDEYVEKKYRVEVAECEVLLNNGENGATLDYVRIVIDAKSEYLAAEIKTDVSEKYECEIYLSFAHRG